MATEQSRITVIGTRRRIDLAVPASTPIGEYVPRLAELCGEEESPAMPAAWSLAPADAPAIPLDATLADMGVLDGQVLYLRDIAVEPGDPPVVMDIDEVVADEAGRLRRQRMHAGPVVLALGLGWLLAAAFLTGWRTAADTGSALALLLAGLLLLGAGWGLRQRPSAVPDWLVHVVVLAAAPCFALSGMQITGSLLGDGHQWTGAVVGANLALMMALAVGPGVVLMAVEAQLAVAAVLVPLAYGLEADRVETAALVAAVALGLLAVSRRIAAMVTAWGNRVPAGRQAAAVATTELTSSSSRVLSVVMAGPTLALAVTLPMLALSGRGFALASAAILTLGLLVRARHAAFTNELLMIGGAATVGLFTLMIPLAWLVGVTGTAAQALLIAAGVAVTAVGIGMSVLMRSPADQPEPLSDRPRKPRKRSRSEVIGAIAAVAVAPLTMGVFGVFSDLVWFGRTLF
ncbi:EsaB/YukD family protein [Micromonospora sp. NPDC049044]|uniref:EsaB/YukD family protein n=1 Tax=Micromonospora sp. NPDC049044 TaxID=3154827 RepID=UPI0033DC9116